jgi:hypothetical protein
MICIRCNRPLSAATMMIGKHPIGPTCAKKMGLARPKQGRTKAVNRYHPVHSEQDQLILDL